MREVKDDIWSYWKRKDWCVIVTTNGHINKGGEAATGAGLARQANILFKGFDKMLGECMRQEGNRLYYFKDARIITFPTKKHWRDNSDITLIKESCLQLKKLMDEIPDLKIAMPKVGCGFGRLKWAKIKPILEKYFGKYSDKRFVIVDNNQGATKEYLKDNPDNLVDMHDKSNKVIIEDADYRITPPEGEINE